MKRTIAYSAIALAMTAPGAAGEHARLSIGERFHQETSLTWRSALADLLRAKPKRPPLYKEFTGEQTIILPKPEFRGRRFEDVVIKRRSVREYSPAPLSLEEVSQILFAAQGVTGSLHGTPLRTAPSAGALYPFELYAVVHNVKGLQKGIYHYAVREHALTLLKTGDFGSDMTRAGLEQEMLGDSAVTLVLTAVFNRTRHKYGERGFRYVYMEAGHISQNIALQAVSLGLGSVPVGAFLDEKVNALVGADGREEAAIYLHAVGRP